MTRQAQDAAALSVAVPLATGLMSAIAVAVVADEGALASASRVTVAIVAGVVSTCVSLGAVLLQRRLGSATLHRLHELETQATHDQLTGLATRDTIHSRLDEAVRESGRRKDHLAVLFLDLDGFKGINDAMGHETGDEVLRAFAIRLQASLRSSDIVGRFGGDEFVAICPGLATPSLAFELAQTILDNFQEPLELSETEIQVVPSIGIAIGGVDVMVGAGELIARADQAMYRAKRSGGGFKEYDGTQLQEATSRLAVEQAIGPALAEGQFSVYYQPIVSQRQGRTVGVEGLIRWMHPELGVLGPDHFLSIAEEAGLAARLGDVVLREVVAQTAIWNHIFGGPLFPSGVNLGERQLVDASFPERVAELAEWCSIEPSQLSMEISEDLLLRRVDDANRVIHRLAELGCRIVIDDFGIRQGAFSRIKSLSIVDMIKIDRSVVETVEHDPVNRAVIEATLSMAGALGLEVVAEGVETVAQKARLEELGVDLMQGFLFQRPMSAEALGLEGPKLQLEPSTPGADQGSSSLSSRSSKLRALIDG